MKNTIKLLIKRICIYFASATTFWLIACQPEDLPLKVENKNFSKLMVTRTLSETGTPNDFFYYSDTTRFGRLIPALQHIDSITPFVKAFKQTYGLPLWECSWLEKVKMETFASYLY